MLVSANFQTGKFNDMKSNTFVMRRSAVRVCVPAPISITYAAFFLALSYRWAIVLLAVVGSTDMGVNSPYRIRGTAF